jgi:hypothetical protein
LVCFVLVWFGLVCFVLFYFVLFCFVLFCFGLVWFGLVCFGLFCFVLLQFLFNIVFLSDQIVLCALLVAEAESSQNASMVYGNSTRPFSLAAAALSIQLSSVKCWVMLQSLVLLLRAISLT